MELIPGRVMVFGTFDIFHPGHQNFIQQALDEADELIVVVARDKTVYRFKEVLRNTEKDRQKAIKAVFPHIKVVLGDRLHPMAQIKKYRPEKICLGYDQIGFRDQLVEEFPQIKIKRLKAFHPEKYKSSLMQGDPNQ